MAILITRTAGTDDDGSGTTGTVVNAAWKAEIYDQIDADIATFAPAAGQFIFPATQNPSAGANVLDDYEEGTWVPVIGGSGGTSAQTYTAQTGSYLKIGKFVIVIFQALLSAKGTITGNVELHGLPFTSAGTYCSASLDFGVLATTWVNLILRLAAGVTVASVQGTTIAAVSNNVPLTTTDITNTTQLIGQLSYIASA